MSKFLVSVLCTLLFAQCVSTTINLPIQNPSFDQIPTGAYQISTSCGLQATPIPGWGNGGWTFQLADSNPCGISLPPGGSTNAALVQNSTISQDTNVKALDLQGGSPGNGVYELQFFVTNYFVGYEGYYEARISFGSQELCSTDGWAMQTSMKVTLVCPAQQGLATVGFPAGQVYASDPNAHIIVSLSHSKGWMLLFKNVSLTYTPVS